MRSWALWWGRSCGSCEQWGRVVDCQANAYNTEANAATVRREARAEHIRIVAVKQVKILDGLNPERIAVAQTCIGKTHSQ